MERPFEPIRTGILLINSVYILGWRVHIRWLEQNPDDFPEYIGWIASGISRRQCSVPHSQCRLLILKLEIGKRNSCTDGADYKGHSIQRTCEKRELRV